MVQALYGAFGSDATGQTCQFAYFDRNRQIIGAWSTSGVHESPAGSGNYFIYDTPPNNAYFISFRITALSPARYTADALKPEHNAYVFNFTGAGTYGQGQIVGYRFYDANGNQTPPLVGYTAGVSEVVLNAGVYLCVAPNVPTDAVIVVPRIILYNLIGGPSPIVQSAPAASVGPHSAIKKALYELLIGDSILMSMVTAIGDWPTPKTQYPYITFLQNARQGWRSKDTDGREVDINIHVWTDYRGFNQADLIQDQVFSLMINNVLQLDVASGYYAVATSLATDTSRELIEPDAGKFLRHIVMPFEVQIKELN